jgi:hypothetical protein
VWPVLIEGKKGGLGTLATGGEDDERRFGQFALSHVLRIVDSRNTVPHCEPQSLCLHSFVDAAYPRCDAGVGQTTSSGGLSPVSSAVAGLRTGNQQLGIQHQLCAG